MVVIRAANIYGTFLLLVAFAKGLIDYYIMYLKQYNEVGTVTVIFSSGNGAQKVKNLVQEICYCNCLL